MGTDKTFLDALNPVIGAILQNENGTKLRRYL
jgi:hypothetical protein